MLQKSQKQHKIVDKTDLESCFTKQLVQVFFGMLISDLYTWVISLLFQEV